MLAMGQAETLLERIAESHEKLAEECDAIIVEGLHVSSENQFLNELNPRLANALNAEVIFVASDKRSHEMMDYAKLNRHLEARRTITSAIS